MSDEVVDKSVEEEKAPEGLPDLLRRYPNSPGPEQIEQWKLQHGEVFVSGFSETELYVWRAIKRPEWVKLQQFANNPENKVDQFVFEEMVCETCVLWKSVPGKFSDGKAGAASSLQEMILQNSCFLTPQAASLLVSKL